MQATLGHGASRSLSGRLLCPGRSRLEPRRACWQESLAAMREGLDAPRGFEPRLTESESVVLPLDDGATGGCL